MNDEHGGVYPGTFLRKGKLGKLAAMIPFGGMFGDHLRHPALNARDRLRHPVRDLRHRLQHIACSVRYYGIVPGAQWLPDGEDESYQPCLVRANVGPSFDSAQSPVL